MSWSDSSSHPGAVTGPEPKTAYFPPAHRDSILIVPPHSQTIRREVVDHLCFSSLGLLGFAMIVPGMRRVRSARH